MNNLFFQIQPSANSTFFSKYAFEHFYLYQKFLNKHGVQKRTIIFLIFGKSLFKLDHFSNLSEANVIIISRQN